MLEVKNDDMLKILENSYFDLSDFNLLIDFNLRFDNFEGSRKLKIVGIEIE